MEETKRFCVGIRKTAKEERVLFYYNGHGVPKPTASGEIWVFNKSEYGIDCYLTDFKITRNTFP